MTKTLANDGVGSDEIGVAACITASICFLGSFWDWVFSRRRRCGILMQIWHFTGQISPAFFTTNEMDGLMDWSV